MGEERDAWKSLRPRRSKADSPASAGVEIGGCDVPEDRLYDLENEVWYLPDPSGGSGRVGLLGPLVWFAGRFQSVTFRPIVGTVGQGRSVATVESQRYTGAVRLPMDAEIVERNPAVVERPRLLNDAPYSEGWIVRVRPVSDATLPSTLQSVEAIRDRLIERIRDRRIRCWPRTRKSRCSRSGSNAPRY